MMTPEELEAEVRDIKARARAAGYAYAVRKISTGQRMIDPADDRADEEAPSDPWRWSLEWLDGARDAARQDPALEAAFQRGRVAGYAAAIAQEVYGEGDLIDDSVGPAPGDEPDPEAYELGWRAGRRRHP